MHGSDLCPGNCSYPSLRKCEIAGIKVTEEDPTAGAGRPRECLSVTASPSRQV